jgi:PhoPQ-activated pathogenicity-related protein
MDAIRAFAVAERWESVPEKYLVTGGSKRGWASWLAAVVDPRVFAVAPIVIEIKMRQQMAHQLEILGANTDKLAPYSSRGLTNPAKFDTVEGRQLWKWVDPWMYRERLQMPKLMIKATNDPWWLLDSMNFYWDDLTGPKHCLYFSNEVHELPSSRLQAAAVVSAFFLRAARGETLPEITWKHESGDNDMKLSVRAENKPAKAKLWVATSPTRDFRDSRWSATEMTFDGDAYSGAQQRADGKHTAVFAELQFSDEGLKYSLSTDVRAE